MTEESLPVVTIETITPDTAKQILKKNTENRPLRKRTEVPRIADAIRNGRWQMNGDTIRLAEDGTVLDGQNRLSAIVEAGIAVQTLVVRGLKKDCFKTIDTTRATRSAKDLLAINKEKNYSALAAVAKPSYLYEMTGEPFNSNAIKQPAPDQLVEFIDRNQSLKESAAEARKYLSHFSGMVSVGTIGFAHWMMSPVDSNAADIFMTGLCSGVGLETGSPVLLCRNRIIDDRSSKLRMSQRYKAALIFKAWRLFIDGATVKTLRVREEGQAKERNLWAV